MQKIIDTTVGGIREFFLEQDLPINPSSVIPAEQLLEILLKSMYMLKKLSNCCCILLGSFLGLLGCSSRDGLKEFGDGKKYYMDNCSHCHGRNQASGNNISSIYKFNGYDSLTLLT